MQLFKDVVSLDEIEKEWRDFDFEDRMAARAVDTMGVTWESFGDIITLKH